MTVKAAIRPLMALASLVPFFAYGADILSCDQKQNMCKAQCQVTNIGDDSNLKTCEARCLGERVSCSISVGVKTAREAAEGAKDSGADIGNKAKEVGEDIGDKAKAFWDGVTNQEPVRE